MSLQHEILFERLVPRYEKRFGEAPPVDGLPVDEAVKVIRGRLAMQEKVWSDHPSAAGLPARP